MYVSHLDWQKVFCAGPEALASCTHPSRHSTNVSAELLAGWQMHLPGLGFKSSRCHHCVSLGSSSTSPTEIAMPASQANHLHSCSRLYCIPAVKACHQNTCTHSNAASTSILSFSNFAYRVFWRGMVVPKPTAKVCQRLRCLFTESAKCSNNPCYCIKQFETFVWLSRTPRIFHWLMPASSCLQMCPCCVNLVSHVNTTLAASPCLCNVFSAFATVLVQGVLEVEADCRQALQAGGKPALLDVHGGLGSGERDYELDPTAKRYEVYEMSFAAKVRTGQA